MQGWKVLLGIVAGALLFFVTAALIMPSQYLSAQAYVIRAEPEMIFDRLVRLEQWPTWTIWNKDSDGTFVTSFEGTDGEVGGVLSWRSERYGQVRRELLSVDRPRELNFALQLKPGLAPAKERITLEPVETPTGRGTKVTWGILGDVGDNLFERLKIGVMQRNAADAFYQNLWRLSYWTELASGAIRLRPDGGIENLPWPRDGGVQDAGAGGAGPVPDGGVFPAPGPAQGPSPVGG